MVFSERNARATKMLEPGELVFMMNAEAKQDADQFSLAASVSWQI